MKVGSKDYNSLPAVVHHEPMQSMKQPFDEQKTRDSNFLPAVSHPGSDQGISEHNKNPDGLRPDISLLETKSVPAHRIPVAHVQEGRRKQNHKAYSSENGSSAAVNR